LEDSKPAVGLYSKRTPHTLTSKTTIQKESWTFVCGTYDGNELKIYINGQLDNSKLKQLKRKPKKADLSIWIGHRRRNKRDKHFTGLLDEIRLYNRALSESEVQKLYSLKDGDFRAYKPNIHTKPTEGDDEGCQQATFSSDTDMLYIPDLDMDGKHYKIFMLRGDDKSTFTIIKKIPVE
jgi:hypothetical protein